VLQGPRPTPAAQALSAFIESRLPAQSVPVTPA